MKKIILTRGQLYNSPIIISEDDVMVTSEGEGANPVISTPYKWAIYAKGRKNITVSGIDIVDSGGGIHFTKCNSIVIEDCNIYRIKDLYQGSNIFISFSWFVKIRRNFLADNYNDEHQLYIGYGSGFAEIEDNTFLQSEGIGQNQTVLQMFGRYGGDTQNYCFNVQGNTVIGGRAQMNCYNMNMAKVHNNTLVGYKKSLIEHMHWGDDNEKVDFKDNKEIVV